MKFITFRTANGSAAGLLMGDGKVVNLHDKFGYSDALDVIESAPAALEAIGSYSASKAAIAVSVEALELLPPIPSPRKNIFCVGRNYIKHIEEGARARGVEPSFPKIPEFFSKPTTAVIGSGAAIERHAAHTAQLDYEVELAVVIGKRARNLSVENALSVIFGYTIVNDISARDAQAGHGQWFKGKAFDTFCPIGPCIVTSDEFGDASGHRISLRVNDEVRQDSNTSDMLFSIEQILSSLSAGMTLEPGDIIATGTPSGVALGMKPQKWLNVGDVIEAEVQGIGILRNYVASDIR